MRLAGASAQSSRHRPGRPIAKEAIDPDLQREAAACQEACEMVRVYPEGWARLVPQGCELAVGRRRTPGRVGQPLARAGFEDRPQDPHQDLHPVVDAFESQLPASPAQGCERPPCRDGEDGRVTTKRTSSTPTNKSGNRKVFVANPNRRGFVVTRTELDAVEDVARFRALRTDQLLRLHWPKPSQRRHGESRLRELFHQGWLDRTPFYDAPGPPRAIYTLGALGRRHCRTTAPLSIDLSAGRERMRDVLFLRHWLFTTDCVITLRLAAEATGGGLVQLLDERRLRRMLAAVRSDMTVVPDAFVALRVGDAVRGFCIEADRGTVDVRAWRSKVARYLDWTVAPSFKTTFVSPTVLTIVDASACNGDRRVDELATATEGVVADRREDPTMFLFANSAALDGPTAFGAPIWRVGGRAGLVRLGGRGRA
jgi:hypothetical protein